jgi:hypothetical protein
MSTLLEQASLVLIPSGYKEDVVYSQIPTNGNGDLSFTRASNGTRVNSAGLVEVCPWNLAQYSEDLSNGVWTKVRTTIASNDIAAPNGTTTADKLSANATLTSSFFYIGHDSINAIVGQSYTATLYAKAGTLTQMMMYLGASNGIYWNLSNGQFISYYSGVQNITSYNSESVGNGWYKYTISINATITTIPIESYSAKSGDLVANYTTADNYYLWGAQLNIGATAKPYFPTTDRLNVPRLTYQNGGGGCPSLLLEKQSTNYFTYSEQLQTGTGGTLTVTPNTAISPDGTQNADSLGTGYLTKSISATAGTWTFSTFAKYLSADTFNIYIYDGGYYAATFNVSTGVVTSVSSGVTASIQNMGNGWYRCIMTATTANNVIEVGFGSGNIYAWGCQFESGSYATSAIPTTSASATRVADTYQKAGIGNTSTAGTLYYEFSGYQPSTPANGQYLLQLFAGSSVGSAFFSDANSISIINNGVSIEGRNDGFATTLFYFAPTSATVKVALRYNGTNVVAFVNGVKQTVYSDTAVGVKNAIRVNNAENGSQATKQLIFFPTALTDAECISLTTI